ncbi:MAG: helix-turn-helix transcriptional regulator [Bryobacteraceae bacterium]
MAEAQQGADRPAALGAGSFYGAVEGKQERCGAIFTDLCHTSPRRLPSHSHELPFFGLLLDGLYGEQYGRQQTQFRPFTIMFRPAGIPHQDEIGPDGVRFFEIEVRPSWRKRLEECSGVLDRPYEDRAGGEVLWLGMRLYRELHAGTSDEFEVESLLSELLSAVARMPAERVHERPSWLVRIIDKITAEYTSRLTLDDLSVVAGVHPVHLSRTFRRWKGQGIGEYIHRLRIRAACEQMLKPEMPIADIGLATGFADQSHFTRSFRRLTGMSPARFREQLSAAGSNLSASSQQDIPESLQLGV